MTTPAAPSWTPQQLAAIDHRVGDLLVSAAAGSGKTAVLAERCARLVCEPAPGQCNIENLLVLTFTEAAAHEMRERIGVAIRRYIAAADPKDPHTRSLLRQEAMLDRAAISTLHAFCARILRQHFNEVGIDPTFTLIDEEEARLLQEQMLQDLLETAYKNNDPLASNAFKALFEAYAGGNELAFKQLILRLHRMLESTHDPAAWTADARRVYAEPEAAVQHYFQHTLPRELDMLAAVAKRMLADIEQQLADGVATKMYQQFAAACQRIELAATELHTRGTDATDFVKDALTEKWPMLTTIKESSFENLKKRTWEKLKDMMKKSADKLFALSPALLRQDLTKLVSQIDTLLAITQDFQTRYTAAKRDRNRLDFADLERLTLNLLTDPAAAAPAELRARYHYILVDEFQDINPLQHALLMALRTPPVIEGNERPDAGNLFMVGDVKQSIYGFRLAEPALFLQRESRARTANIGLLPLPHNFRTHPHRLNLLNALFETLLTPAVAEIDYRQQGHALQAPPSNAILDRLPPAELLLVTTKDTPSDDDAESPDKGDSPTATEMEARMVATRLRQLLDARTPIRIKSGATEPLRPRHIAILLRSVKSAGPVFVQALAREGIPAHATLSTGYFDAPEVAHTLALLETIDNAQQDIPLATALLGPYSGGFSHDDLATIRLTYDRHAVPFSNAVERYARDAILPKGTRIPDLATAALPFDADLAARLKRFFDRLSQWRDWVRTRPLHEALAAIYTESRIFAYLAALGDDSKANIGDEPAATANQRIANLQALHGRALAFASFSKQGLHRFLRFIDKLQENEQDFGEAPILSEADDVVRILTVHKSKGLEFPLVVAAGLGTKFNDRGSNVTFDRHFGIGLKVVDLDRHITYPSLTSLEIEQRQGRLRRAEELRLLYVAFTRAREQLIFSGSIATAEKLFSIRDEWEAYKRISTKPHTLPEDVLLQATKPLDWLLPAITIATLNVAWPEETGENAGRPREESLAAADLAISLHAPETRATNTAANPWNDANLDQLLAETGEAQTASAEESLRALIARVSWQYPHAAISIARGVRTVSELKSLVPPVPNAAGDDSEDDLPDADIAPTLSHNASSPKAEEAKLRGIATHRILELLNFSTIHTAEDIRQQTDALVAAKKMSAEELARADLPGIEWLLLDTHTGKRMRTANPAHLYREIPFAIAMPIDTPNISLPDPANAPLFAQLANEPTPVAIEDAPTVRGTIDLLLADPAAAIAEIVDFKTDRDPTPETVAKYRRQMGYYLRAASAILGYPVSHATLFFLTTRQEHVVKAAN